MESISISPNEVLKDAYYKHISLSNTVKRKTADFIRFINNLFIPLMRKRDILFDFLFQQVYLEGSYINTHKTYNANECNLNIVLNDFEQFYVIYLILTCSFTNNQHLGEMMILLQNVLRNWTSFSINWECITVFKCF